MLQSCFYLFYTTLSSGLKLQTNISNSAFSSDYSMDCLMILFHSKTTIVGKYFQVDISCFDIFYSQMIYFNLHKWVYIILKIKTKCCLYLFNSMSETETLIFKIYILCMVIIQIKTTIVEFYFGCGDLLTSASKSKLSSIMINNTYIYI